MMWVSCNFCEWQGWLYSRILQLDRRDKKDYLTSPLLPALCAILTVTVSAVHASGPVRFLCFFFWSSKFATRIFNWIKTISYFNTRPFHKK